MAEDARAARRAERGAVPAQPRVAERTPVPAEPAVVHYGAHPAQFFEVHRPAGDGPYPVVLLIHGGFWRLPWGLELMRPLALDLVERGYAAVNVEYRRLGEDGGGWPGSCEDVAAAVRALAGLGEADAAGSAGDVGHAGSADAPELDGGEEGSDVGAALDLGRIGLVGHSAGGHLALWTAHHAAVAVRIIVSQAGVVDLRAAVRDRLDEENGKPPAALEFLGDPPADASTAPSDASTAPSAGMPVGTLAGTSADPATGPCPGPSVYPLASPIEMAPLGPGVRQLLLHGDVDARVPQAQSLDYARVAGLAGDDVRLAAFTGMGHFELIDPSHRSWHVTMAELDRYLRPGA